MSPVNLAGSVSEISPHHPFLCKNIDVFIWKAGLAQLPRSQVLWAEISVTWINIFPYEHSSPVTRMKHVRQNSFALTTYSSQNGIILVFMYFHFRSMRNSFIGYKSPQGYDSPEHTSLCSTILVVFLEFIPADQLKFPIWTHHRIYHGNRASPVTGLIWRGPKSNAKTN